MEKERNLILSSNGTIFSFKFKILLDLGLSIYRGGMLLTLYLPINVLIFAFSVYYFNITYYFVHMNN